MPVRRPPRRTICVFAAGISALLAASAANAHRMHDGGRARAGVLDKTFQCATQMGEFRVEAHPDGQGTPPYPPAGVTLMTGTGGTTILFGLEATYQSYRIDGSLCRRSARTIKLSSAKLVSVGTFRTPEYEAFYVRCLFGGPLFLRVRARFGADGSPAAATIALARKKHSTPIAYLTWTPAKVKAFGSPKCGA